jgi:glycerol-3-phosphate cytidylyltransferase
MKADDSHGQDRRVVFTDGAFDLMHHNHIEFLREACELGDRLLVGVVSDGLCRSYKRQPILTQDERLRAVRALAFVDEACLFEGPFAAAVMEMLIARHAVTTVVYGGHWSRSDYYEPAIRRGAVRRCAR